MRWMRTHAYTRHLTTIALSEKSAPSVARALVHEAFMKIGLTETAAHMSHTLTTDETHFQAHDAL